MYALDKCEGLLMRSTSSTTGSRRGLLKVAVAGFALVLLAPVAAAGALAAATAETGGDGPLPQPGTSPSPGDGLEVARLLGHPNVTMTGWAAADLRAGVVDHRLVATLILLADRWPIDILGFKAGHSMCIGGGNTPGCPGSHVSNHFYGRAADVMAVDGRPVSPTNRAAFDAVVWLIGLPAPYRPGELGNPWPQFDPLPGVYSDASHRNHLHVGFYQE
jgi:hypothetical protein